MNHIVVGESRTGQMEDEPATSPPQRQHHRQGQGQRNEDRIRRNVACVNCRDSKVRCLQSHVSGEPCQRCAKLDLSCVVDKSHKRITKKSKLEKLEQELDAIRQVVAVPVAAGTSAAAAAAAVAAVRSDEPPRPPRSPRASQTSASQESRPSLSHHGGRPWESTATPTPGNSNNTQQRQEQTAPPVLSHASSRRPPKDLPSQPRTIGDKRVSGEDVDFYFDKYLELYHPLVPVLRNRDPDACYQASSTLFWIVVSVACRRYSRDPDLLAILVDNLSRDIWAVLLLPITKLETIHALLLFCAWPMPTIRLVTDPSTVLASIALNVSMIVGLHTGRGSHPEFCVGRRVNMTFTDEDAAVTWVQACILAQRAAANIGQPPPSIQLGDAPSKKALSSPEWSDLLVSYDVQRYLNRFHLAMASHVTNHGHVPESSVSDWEDEFEMLKGTLSRRDRDPDPKFLSRSNSDSDCDPDPDSDSTRLVLLTAKQEIQSYYFAYPPDNPGPNLAVNTARALLTARSIIFTALALEASPLRLLSHSPGWVFRSVVAAASLLVSALHSQSPPPLDVAGHQTQATTAAAAAAEAAPPPPPSSTSHSHTVPTRQQQSSSGSPDPSAAAAAAADDLVNKCISALEACSICDADLPDRSANIIRGFWSQRRRIPVIGPAAMSWPNRLSAGTTFWCLARLHRNVTDLQGYNALGDGTGAPAARINGPRHQQHQDQNQSHDRDQNQMQDQDRNQPQDQQQQQQSCLAPQKYLNRRKKDDLYRGNNSSVGHGPTAEPDHTSRKQSLDTNVTANATAAATTIPQNFDAFGGVDWSMFMDEFNWDDSETLFTGMS